MQLLLVLEAGVVTAGNHAAMCGGGLDLARAFAESEKNACYADALVTRKQNTCKILTRRLASKLAIETQCVSHNTRVLLSPNNC